MNKLWVSLAAVATGLMIAVGANASIITMTLTSPSHMKIQATYLGAPLVAQGVGGDDTTYQGTITVEVDNLLAPTTIKILSANADADVSGNWLPKVSPSQTVFTPAAPADYGMKYVVFGQPAALGAFRDVAFNMTANQEAVDGAGQFSSVLQNLTFLPGGTFDFWVDPQIGGGFGHDNLSGSSTNSGAGLSSYVVSGTKATLTIPVNIPLSGSDPKTGYTGIFVATADVPEPATWMLMGLGMIGLVTVARRKYGR